MKINRKEIAKFAFMFCLAVALISFASATTTLVSPTNGTSYTGSITVNCTTDLPEPLNVTFYYDSAGGVPSTVMTSITNTSASQTVFNKSFSTTGLTDSTSYNVTCVANNGTDTDTSTAKASITIDNTAPAASFTTDGASSIPIRLSKTITTTASDATSGLASYVITITSPDSTNCPTITETDNPYIVLTGEQTKCSGTYTISLLATDNVGLTTSQSSTFSTVIAGSVGKSQTTKTSSSNNIIVIIAIIVIVYLIVRRKK